MCWGQACRLGCRRPDRVRAAEPRRDPNGGFHHERSSAAHAARDRGLLCPDDARRVAGEHSRGVAGGRPRQGGRQRRHPLPLRPLLAQHLRLRAQHRARRARGRGRHAARLHEADDGAHQVRRARRAVLRLAPAPGAQRRHRPPARPPRDAGRGDLRRGRARRRRGDGPLADPARRAEHAARRAAQRRRAAPRGRPDAGRDRLGHGAQRELDPRPAPPRPPRAAVRADAARGGAQHGRPGGRGMSATHSPAAPGAFAVPFVRLDRDDPELIEELLAEVRTVATEGAFVLGAHVEAFEADFAAYCGADEAIGVASGTDALALALRALGVGRGDEVIVPANTFIATAEAVTIAGATPRPVDVDPQTGLLTAEIVERALHPRVRCVIPVHLYGATVDMGPLLQLARVAGIAVVEDACQAHGARYRGRRVGALGDIGAFSFYPAKNLGAWGDGGAVVTNRPELAERVRLLRSHGERPRYRHREIGSTARLDGLQAAVLRVKLGHLDGWNAQRRRAAAELRRALHATG